MVYFLLSVGAVTTLYPFLLMVSTGFKGPTDEKDTALVPRVWFDHDQLYDKYIHDKYKLDENAISSTRTGATASAEVLERYRQFLMGLPPSDWKAGFVTGPGQMTSRLSGLYQDWLRRRFDGDIDRYNRTYLEEQTTFDAVDVPAELLDRPSWKPKPGPRWEDWIEFKKTLPAEFRLPIFARQLFQGFVKGKYKVFDQVPKEIAGSAKDFNQIDLPVPEHEEMRRPPNGTMYSVMVGSTNLDAYREFREKSLPARFRTQTIEDRWTAASGRAPLPIEAFERDTLAKRETEIKGEMSGRNFRYVLGFILLHGRALWNTALFALLTIAAQLIINPLAAYALSRYPIKASGKSLLFLLATMAFPAEVAMIPSFLLLKGLGLLNTFAALVLPTAASGYMIFLLKGFFDSLPQELFEAGQLDGAKETTLMMRVALPLSKPVLGYMALLAFMGAYGAFLYAFLIAQDQKMWTLMVYIYQLQTAGAPRSLLMAALTLAAIPTLVIFLLCQRVIMRGIVLPGER